MYENKKKATKVLGKYVMGDVLGEGSYAKVIFLLWLLLLALPLLLLLYLQLLLRLPLR